MPANHSPCFSSVAGAILYHATKAAATIKSDSDSRLYFIPLLRSVNVDSIKSLLAANGSDSNR